MGGHSYRIHLLFATVLQTLASLAVADLPIDCHYSDALGTWLVTETDRTGDTSLDCSELGDIVHIKQFTMIYPNTVTDELGNAGTWTMIYNQGFEVDINGRSYWAPFFYNSTGYDCSRLHNGWSRDETIRNWACYTATKMGAQKDSNSFQPFARAESRLLDLPYSNSFQPFARPESRLLDLPYKNDHTYIDRINAAQDSWTAKAYPQHEQYTVREMLQRGGGASHPLPPLLPPTKDLLARASLLPKSFDWRNVEGVNYVSPVRDQLRCGSCYTFASTGMLESRIRILTNFSRQDIFSNQDLVSCTKLNEGCAGGFSYLIAGRYAHEQGFVLEECNPYQGTDEACDTDMSCRRTFVSDYEFVGGYYGASNEQIMLEALIARGPLAVDYNVESDFYNYESGIYHHTPSVMKSDFDPLFVVNHAVLIVGYGEDSSTGEKYWIVKNSWGEAWGEEGYFRIRRGTNEVGIESAPFDATVIP